MLPIGMQIADAQFEVLKELADKGSCVIIGRCSNMVLKDMPEAIHIFIKADVNARIERAVKLYGISNAEAGKLIKQTDKVRASYYTKHTGEKWGESKNYQLIVDSELIGTDGAAKVIEAYVEEILAKRQ